MAQRFSSRQQDSFREREQTYPRNNRLPPRKLRNFVQECRKYQEMMRHTELLHTPRILHNTVPEVIWTDFVSHSIFENGRSFNAKDKTLVENIIGVIRLRSSELSHFRDGEVHVGVLYMPCYGFQSEDIYVVPLFKIYENNRPRFYITKHGLVHLTLDDFLDHNDLPHCLACVPEGGEYSTSRINLQFNNINRWKRFDSSNSSQPILGPYSLVLGTFTPIGFSLAVGIYVGHYLASSTHRYVNNINYNQMDPSGVKYQFNRCLEGCYRNIEKTMAYLCESGLQVISTLVNWLKSAIGENNVNNVAYCLKLLRNFFVIRCNWIVSLEELAILVVNCLYQNILKGCSRQSSRLKKALSLMSFSDSKIEELIRLIFSLFSKDFLHDNSTPQIFTALVKCVIHVVTHIRKRKLQGYNLPHTKELENIARASQQDFSLETFQRNFDQTRPFGEDVSMTKIFRSWDMKCTVWETEADICEAVNVVVTKLDRNLKLRSKSNYLVEVETGDGAIIQLCQLPGVVLAVVIGETNIIL